MNLRGSVFDSTRAREMVNENGSFLSNRSSSSHKKKFQKTYRRKLRIWGSGVRISSGAPLRNQTGHAKTRRLCALRAQQSAFAAHDANPLCVDFNALGERAEGVATVAGGLGPQPPASVSDEGLQRLRRACVIRRMCVTRRSARSYRRSSTETGISSSPAGCRSHRSM